MHHVCDKQQINKTFGSHWIVLSLMIDLSVNTVWSRVVVQVQLAHPIDLISGFVQAYTRYTR